jgi:hypothetical protein
MRHYLLAFAMAGAVALAATAGAQAPAQPSQTPETPQTMPGATTPEQGAPEVTIDGCLMREADVPGREPNVAERAGVTEDYILTDAKIVEGSEGGTAEASGVAAAGESMYEVEGIDDEQLKQHVGSRVQIKGTLEDVDEAQDPPEGGTPTDDLAEIRGTSIDKAPSGECPAAQ